MQTLLFVNFSDEAFTGMWDSQPYPFAPGQSMYMEDWKAKHFAKHLVNRELLKVGLETHTSPKERDGKIDDLEFLNLFNKAVLTSEVEDTASEAPESVIATQVIDRNFKAKKTGKTKKAEQVTDEVEFAGLEETN